MKMITDEKLSEKLRVCINYNVIMFSPTLVHEAANRQVVKWRETKTSGYLGLESHFHADARVRI